MAAGLTGRFFGFLFIFLGVWQALAGALVDGLWLAFVGWFLESAAGSQLHVEWMKNLLGGHRVADAMERNLLHVPPGASVEEMVERVMIPAQTRTALVTTIDGTVGMVTLDALHGVPRAEWSATSASHVMSPVAQMETTQPDAILWAAVERMGKGGVEVLPVLERGVVVGMLSREDILHYLSVLQGLQEWKSIDGAR